MKLDEKYFRVIYIILKLFVVATFLTNFVLNLQAIQSKHSFELNYPIWNVELNIPGLFRSSAFPSLLIYLWYILRYFFTICFLTFYVRQGFYSIIATFRFNIFFNLGSPLLPGVFLWYLFLLQRSRTIYIFLFHKYIWLDLIIWNKIRYYKIMII